MTEIERLRELAKKHDGGKTDAPASSIDRLRALAEKHDTTSATNNVKPQITAPATNNIKPQISSSGTIKNTQPVTTQITRPVIDPLDEDALRINMANNRTGAPALTKGVSFVAKNLYNNIVKPAGQAIDRQYEKLDDYNFGEKALNDAYRIAQENKQNVWDEEALRLQRLKNDYDKLLSYMTPEQKVQYSRLPENKKKDYLDGIMAQLQMGKGAARAEEIRNINDRTNQNLQKIGLSFESGMGGFKTGLKGAYNLMRGADETVAKNASEYAFNELRPETTGALGVAMDLSNTIGNMAPSIALGLVGGPLGVGALGTAAMGVSSGGKGYDSAIGEGYTPEQAAAYGIASGVSEALLQRIAGALPGVSNAQGLVTRFLGKYGDDVLSKVVSNPSLRKALVTLLGNAASEGSEEGAQEIIDTFIRNAVLGENNNINWKDVGYSALLGGMTGGAFALPRGVSTVINRDRSIDTAQPAPETVENTVDAVQNNVEMPEEVTEENTIAETEPIKVGKATTIYNPYKGMVPVENDGAQYSRVSLKDNSFNDAEKIIESAEIVSNSGEKSYKRILKDVYNKIFGEARNIQVKSLSFDNTPYDVTLNKNIVAKVVSDPNMSAEKLAVLDNLDSIVENSKYVGSSKYEQKGIKKKNTIRFDYFETETEINGNPYIVAFDVEVFPNQNNYRTHKVINEINLTPLTSADTGPEPAANVKVSGSNNIIPSDTENINTSAGISENNLDAMEMENGSKSISMDTEAGKSGLTKKAESYLHRNTNALLNDFLEITETDKFADARTLKRDINTFAEASVRNGAVDKTEAEKLFDRLYWDALKVNTDTYDKYRPLAEQIKNTKLYGGGLGSLEGEYRKKYFNKIRLVTDPSATKIDSYYKELSENYPELFDPEITNIEEQIPAIADAVDYIYNKETKLSDQVSHIDERYNIAKEEFMKSLDKFEEGIGDVIKYNDVKESRAEERAARKAERRETAEKILTDKEFSKSFYKDFTDARRNYEKLTRKVMLTPDDTSIMRQLSEGTIKWDEVERRADEFNIDAIKKVYDAYNAKHQFELTEQEHKANVAKEYRSEAEDHIENSDTWEDKPMGAMYARETMERNIEDITKKGNNKNRRNEDAYWINKTYFKPVHENEAKSNRLKKELVEKVKALNLDTKPKYTVMIENEYTGLPVQTEVSESGLVQLYGEGLITDKDLENFNVDKEKIKNAVNEFRGIYNQLIDLVNNTLIRNGYRPVEYRKDYFPHFTENKPDSTLGKVAAYFGIEMRADELPTDIAGITHTFRPGKKWVGNFLERKTNITDYDALKGFDRYLNGAADVIFHTDDIQRLRALESAIRYKYSDEGTRKRIKEIEESETLTPEEKASRINDIAKANEVSHLPNLVTQLRNYTDNLAGKKSISDRNWEHGMGRSLYNFTKKMENRVSANMVALNPGSWLTNFIPITQVSGIVDSRKLARAIWDTSKGAAKTDGFRDRSDFLVNRKGSEMTFKTITDKIQDTLTKPFGWIDSYTAEIVTRALYYDKMAEVKNEAEALEYANEMAARVMADRSKGAKPTAFNAQNPVAKLFTMFQIEVNNQYSYIFKDVPAEERKKGLANLAWAFVKMFLGAYLYNEVYEKYIGRRAAFDPVDIAASAIDDFTNPDVKKSQAVANAASNVVDELPFVSGLLGGGRVPISSALPSLSKLNEAGVGLYTGEMNSKKAAQQLGKELIKPAAYLVPPVGGGQIKKAVEGISTVAKGGEVTYDNEGNERLKYPIEDKSALKYLQAGLFGKSSLKESQDYYNNGMPTLTVKQTQNYHKAVEAGINYKQYMAALNAAKKAQSDKDKNGNTISLSLAKNKKAAIDAAVKEFNLNRKQKEILYEANEVSNKVW